MATYVVENLPGFFRFIIIEAKDKEAAVSKIVKKLVEIIGNPADFDLEPIISENIVQLADGEVIYVV